jgi:hypothetical protein
LQNEGKPLQADANLPGVFLQVFNTDKKMENKMQVYDLSEDQGRIYIDAAQLHEAYLDAFTKNRAYRGGMHWKKGKGKQYLFRSLDRYGNGKSLGPRTEKTESIYHEFHSNKEQVRTRLKILKNGSSPN